MFYCIIKVTEFEVLLHLFNLMDRRMLVSRLAQFKFQAHFLRIAEVLQQLHDGEFVTIDDETALKWKIDLSGINFDLIEKHQMDIFCSFFTFFSSISAKSSQVFC